MIEYHLSSYFNFEVIGKITYNSMTPPCFICECGTTCEYGALARSMSPEDFAALDTITPEMSRKFENDDVTTASALEIGTKLGQI